MSEISNIKKSIEEVTKLKEEINNMIEFTEIDLDEDMLKDLKQNIKEIKTKIEKFEIEVLLNGEFDHNNAYMEIHSGAGVPADISCAAFQPYNSHNATNAHCAFHPGMHRKDPASGSSRTDTTSHDHRSEVL